MGAWGEGPFENDFAMDWVMSLKDETTWTPVEEAFNRLLAMQGATPPTTEEEYVALEARGIADRHLDEGLAAAAVVAHAHGKGPTVDEDEVGAQAALDDYLPRVGKPSLSLLQDAQHAATVGFTLQDIWWKIAEEDKDVQVAVNAKLLADLEP